MRSQYDVRNTYVGTGLLSDYTFDFKVVNKAHLLVLQITASGVVTWQARGNDTTYFSTTLNENDGVVHLVSVLPAGSVLILLLADDTPTQPNKFINNDKYTLKKIEDSLDYMSAQIQRLAYLQGRTLGLPEQFITTFDPKIPVPVADAVLAISSDASGFGWLDKTSLVGATGPKGDKGDPGNNGAIGPRGATGADGPPAIPTIQGSMITPVLIKTLEGVFFTDTGYFSQKYIAGFGGPITILASPQIQPGSLLGQRLLLTGTSDTNTVTFEDDLGVVVLGLDQSVEYKFNGTDWKRLWSTT